MNLSETLPLHAKYRSTEVAVLEADSGRRVTYAEFESLVRKGVSLFASIGLTPGDIVGLALRDSVEHLALVFACARAKLVMQPVDWRWSAEEVDKALHGFNTAVVIAEDGASPVDDVQWLEVSSLEASPEAEEPWVLDDEDPPLILSLSSGTTGTPKGPLLSTSRYLARFRVLWSDLRLGPEKNFLSCTPLYYGGGRAFALHQLYSGGTVILMSHPYTPERFVETAHRFDAKSAFLVPTMLRRFLQAEQSVLDQMSKIETLICSGSALHEAERNRFVEIFGEGFTQYYASTEGGGVSVLTGDTPSTKSASVGRPVLGVDVRCVDDAGNDVETGEIGRICYRGPSVATSYYNSADGGDAFRDGWFYPGDLASFDDEGYLYIRGRTKDVIIRGGINIYPTDIESTLLAHPSVVECAAVGWPSREFNEEVAVFVTVDGEPDRQELLSFCQSHLARYKWPKGIFVRDELPKSSLGKIRKADLVSQLPEL